MAFLRLQVYFSRRKSATKFLYVKTVSDKVVRYSLAHLIVLSWCYKILFGLVAVTSDDFFTKNSFTSTRSHQYKLYKHHTSACVRSNFFAERIVNAWNNLP